MQHNKPRIHIMRSLSGLKLLIAGCYLIMLMVFGAWWESSSVGGVGERLHFAEQVNQWKRIYNEEPDLRAATITAWYSKDIRLFLASEGLYLARVGLHMPGLQEVVDIATFPEKMSRVEVDGIQCVTWEFAAQINREIGASALVLVRSIPQPSGMVEPGMPWTFDTLAEELLFDALSKVSDTGDHGLDDCNAFPAWVANVAGDGGDLAEKFTNIVNEIGRQLKPGESERDCTDICKAIRRQSLSLHAAHVVTVMAVREIGIPCFGFAGVDPGQAYLVGVFSDQTGWKFINLENIDAGFMTDIPVLLARMPIIGEFADMTHDFWFPGASKVTEYRWESFQTAWQKPEKQSRGLTTGTSCLLAEWQQETP